MDNAMISNTIKSFEEVLRRYGFIKRELSQSQIDMIKDKIKEHERCHQEWLEDDYEDHEDEEMLDIAVYGGGENVAIECANCNSIIIDSEYFI